MHGIYPPPPPPIFTPPHPPSHTQTLRLAERFNIANASSSSDNIVTRGGDQGTATAWDVTTLMCEQHTLLSALWDIPPAHQDDGLETGVTRIVRQSPVIAPDLHPFHIHRRYVRSIWLSQSVLGAFTLDRGESGLNPGGGYRDKHQFIGTVPAKSSAFVSLFIVAHSEGQCALSGPRPSRGRG